jgi:hypothetical protein
VILHVINPSVLVENANKLETGRKTVGIIRQAE